MLCDLNYDKSLTALTKKIKPPGTNHSTDFLEDLERGWFRKYMRDVRPVLLTSKAIQENPRALDIINCFEHIVADEGKFIAEYKELLPGGDIVFSHNDFQENNVMIWN